MIRCEREIVLIPICFNVKWSIVTDSDTDGKLHSLLNCLIGRAVSINQFFLSISVLSQGLVGEKYGSIRVPGEVESAEFEMILDASVEAGLDTRILEEWYCRDENSVPPAYYLKPKTEMLMNYQNSVRTLRITSNVSTPGFEFTHYGAWPIMIYSNWIGFLFTLA